MDVAELLVTAGGVLLIGLTLWFFLGGRIKAKPSAAVFACPMHPWITSSQSVATCSLCGMPLVRREGAI
jgi:hypothetical protein